MILTANDSEFTFSQTIGSLKIPVRDILLIHIDSTYMNALYFVYTDRLLSIRDRIHRLKYSEIESYNGGDVPVFDDLINEIKIFAPARWLSDNNLSIKVITGNYTIQPWDDILLCDSVDNPIILIVSNILFIRKKIFVVKDTGSAKDNPITLVTNGTGVKIDGENSFVLNDNYMSKTITHDGNNFFIL